MRQQTETRRRRTRRGGRDGGRFLPAGLVVLSLVGILLAGAEVGNGRAAAFAGGSGSGSLVPSVDLATTGAMEWNCPGPLALGPARAGRISLLDATSRPVSASLLVAETAVSNTGSERALPPESRRLVVAAHAEMTVPLVAEKVPSTSVTKSKGSRRTKAKRKLTYTVEAAVSVTTSGAALAVSESSSGPSEEASAPCAPGSAATADTASGVTAGFSNLTVSLFNPTDGAAVVDVTVGTGTGGVVPPNYEGVPVAPKSLALLDIGRYVPLRGRVAVSVRATLGRVVLGSLSSIDERVSTGRVGPGHSYIETGEALAVGVAQPFRHWVMPFGPVDAGETEAVRLFDPTARTAVCSLDAALRPGPPAHASTVVGPGATVTAVLAVTGSPLGGTIEVDCSRPVVAEHESYVSSRGGTLLESGSASPARSDGWLIPALEETHRLFAEVDIASDSLRAVPVTVTEISQENPARPPVVLRRFSLEASTSAVIRLAGLLRHGAVGVYGLQVAAGGPITVAGLEVPIGGAGPSSEIVAAVAASR